MEVQNAEAVQSKQDQYSQVVTFRLASEDYAVDIMQVQEINKMYEFTRVPNAPVFVKGVINLRGRIVPIISLRNKFNMEEKEFDKKTRIIVVNMSSIVVGLIVDSVEEVLQIPAKAIENAPTVATNINANYIRGVGKVDDRLIILLDLDQLMTADEQKQILI